MSVNLGDPKIKAKQEALRQLKNAGFYEPEVDNPEGEEHIPMEDEMEAKPEVTMQSDTKNLEDALSGKSKKQKLEDLMKAARE